MSQGVFDDVQLSAIREAAQRVALALGAEKEANKQIISRAVFFLAAEAGVFDINKLAEMAEERLKPHIAWR